MTVLNFQLKYLQQCFIISEETNSWTQGLWRWSCLSEVVRQVSYSGCWPPALSFHCQVPVPVDVWQAAVGADWQQHSSEPTVWPGSADYQRWEYDVRYGQGGSIGVPWLTGFIQVLFLERNSSPSVLWWWALTALAGWTRSETSVLGVEEGDDPWKILFWGQLLQMRWKCNLSQMYPKTRMRRKSFYQPCLLMMRLTTSPKMKLVRKGIVIFDNSVMYISKLNMNKAWMRWMEYGICVF